jgi:transposase, IS5 family
VIPRNGRPGKAGRPTSTAARSQNREMADRQRSPDQHPQTAIRMGPHPLDNLDDAQIWTGHGILAHNLVKIAALAA